MLKFNHFKNANDAFVYLYSFLADKPESKNKTKKCYNVGFYIEDPTDNEIKVAFRRWNKSYAEREWDWYCSKNRSVEELKKYAPIWDKMHNGDNIVNSNYGFLWNENNQLSKTIQQLKDDHETRQAWITIFDGKNKDQFTHDTPCTLAIGFVIENNKLCMSVMMRSNDLWYGFCNDQYCFSKLQIYVAEQLQLEVGWYYHHATDMHLYRQHYNQL